MPTAELDDIALHYDTAGAGDATPVLLVMGFTMRGQVWRFQIPALTERGPVCWFDNRGVGETGATPPPYSMGQLAGDAVGLLDHLGWARAHIVGVSMGGMVAQHLALDHRDRVASLSLIATTAGGSLGRLPTLRGIWHMARGLYGPRRYRASAVAKLLFPRRFRDEIGAEWLSEVLAHDFGQRPPKAGRKGQLRAVFGHDTRARLHELEGLPTLIIKPEHDILVRPKQSDRLHGLIPHSRLLSVPNAGHGLLRQAVDTINRGLLEHFADADADASR